MDTSRSEKMAKAFLARNQPFKRRTMVYEQPVHGPAEIVFKQLCPTREVDWIEIWTADLIWTSTGYGEADCVFTTAAGTEYGPAIWIFTRWEPDRLLELVRIIDNDVVEQMRIDVADAGDGTCRTTWSLKFTALNEAGNAFVEALPEKDPQFERVLSGLDHFVRTGKRMRIHPG